MAKKFCNYIKFIQENNKKFYAIVDELCLMNLFNIRKNEATILNPNENLLKNIQKTIDNGEPEQAVDMIKHLILRKYIKSHEDIGGDISNYLNNKLDDLDGLKKNIKLNNKFQPWETNKNVIVWDYTGTELPKASTPSSYVSNKKKGGHHYNGAEYDALRERLSLSYNIRKQMVKNDFELNYNLYYYVVVSLLTFIQKKDKKLYSSLLYLLDNNPIVTFYVLTQPNLIPSVKQHTFQLVPDSIFKEWYDHNKIPQLENHIVQDLKQVYNKLLDDFKQENSNSFVEINTMRSEILSSLDGNELTPMDLKNRVISKYKNLQKNPEQKLRELFKQDPLLKLRIDEIRFIVNNNNEFIEQNTVQLLDFLDSINWSQTSEDGLIIFKKSLNGSYQYEENKQKFINSVFFMYIPLNKEKNKKIQDIRKSSMTINGGAMGTKKNNKKKKTIIYGGDIHRGYEIKHQVILTEPEMFIDNLPDDVQRKLYSILKERNF
jgi:hypothetical protein